MKIKVQLNNMFSEEYFEFDNTEDLTKAVTFFVQHGKSFTVEVVEEGKDNENGDK